MIPYILLVFCRQICDIDSFIFCLFDFFKNQSDSFYTILFLILFNYLPHIYYLYLYPLKTILHTSSWRL